MTDKRDYYQETIGRIEPEIATIDTGAALASISISLRRIADALEGPKPGESANINWLLWDISSKLGGQS